MIKVLITCDKCGSEIEETLSTTDINNRRTIWGFLSDHGRVLYNHNSEQRVLCDGCLAKLEKLTKDADIVYQNAVESFWKPELNA